jgi:hypothetical protein
MTQDTAQLLTTICLIIGTFLLAIEAAGRERALRLEKTIQKFAHHAEKLFAGVIIMLTAPWKSIEDVLPPEKRTAKSAA